ncbi:PRD domain-containing protein [Terribacillus sp. DMT04]|uniref:BglG family transcription antiterminator n=1 Tax=Terribacillus sp. DMT04 TaxID=2850441 RepID=UPI001C2C6807|nr:PRD domain-containing protein [Terribacillus sp. DMT04]QXE01889.1 PRD domain-containing protein [Terribacillus sp. DMT04]
MSSKDNREQDLLLFLSKKQDYVTSNELVDELDVSQKTVYRLIKKINDESMGSPLILSERGRGYRLDYENFINYQKSNKFHEKQFSPDERRKRIMEELLLSSPKPISIYHLFSDYYVGESVIFNDEQIMSKELKKYNLVLERKDRKLVILGEETEIRKAIKHVNEIFNTIDLDDLKRNQELNFNKYDVLFILGQLRDMEKVLDSTIPYPYNVNIFSHLYILLSRLRKVPALFFIDKVADEEIENMKRDTILYTVAKGVVHNTQTYLNSSLPDIEIYFLYQYLVSSRMQGSGGKTSTFSPEVIQVTDAYIEGMRGYLGIDIESGSIFTDLANHIKPMLNRLEYKIRTKNSLLNQIKANYGDVFSGVAKVSQFVSEKFDLPAINDDENGFITLYFAKVIVTGQYQRPIKTLIMCTTGIGTSELLKAKVSRKFPELEIVDVVASRNMQMVNEKYADAELILSTVHLKDNVPMHQLLVSAMFTMDDQKRLQRKIEEIYHAG